METENPRQGRFPSKGRKGAECKGHLGSLFLAEVSIGLHSPGNSGRVPLPQAGGWGWGGRGREWGFTPSALGGPATGVVVGGDFGAHSRLFSVLPLLSIFLTRVYLHFEFT